MRTLLEKPADQVWLNEYGVRKVLAAAQRTTADQPFVLLADPRDMDFANRAVLNRLSERFAPAYLAAALGRPVRAETFRFAITCERVRGDPHAETPRAGDGGADVDGPVRPRRRGGAGGGARRGPAGRG